MGQLPRPGSRSRVIIALVLTIGPTLALGYFGYRAVADREQSLRVTYAATGVLVRDRLTTELAALEESLARETMSPPQPSDVTAVQAWLRVMAKERPWMADPFIANARGGGVITEQLTYDWPASAPPPRPSGALATALAEAEAAEFGRQDLDDALRRYRRALGQADRGESRALLLSRIGRSQFKLRQFDDALATYRSVLALPPDTLDSRGVPYFVIAYTQIHDCLDATSRSAEVERAALELQRHVVGNPWDLGRGYGYYVKLARQLRATPEPDLSQQMSTLSTAMSTIEWINRDIRPLLDTDARANSHRRLNVMRNDAETVIGIRPLAHETREEGRTTLGYTIPTSYVAGTLLEKVVSGVELGRDVRVVVTPANPSAPERPLATASLGETLPGWSVAIVDARGRTLEQLTARERWTYGGLVGGALVVLVAGLVFTTRAWAREAELSKLRTDFVSNVSHELKTPLALIRMFGETLESGMVADPEKRQEFYGIIRRESERLTHLINNVLDTAKIEAGTKQFTLERGDLVALVTEALDAYAPLFARLHFDVATTLPQRSITVQMDRDAVAQALVNLFQNAIRYSGDARHVAVAITERAGEVAVSVADRGIGIPSVDLARIFDKFYRSNTTAAAEVSGSGLGLSIVKHVMSAHGGRVDVDSIVNQGSVFTLVFPTATIAPGEG